LGYRSSVDLDPRGRFERQPGGLLPAVSTNATGSIELPEQVTFSVRQALGPKWTLLGTIEWQNWSRVGNVSATGSGCPGGTCETLNLNYRDGWLYSVGAEYAYSPALTLRGGVAYETSPITDDTRSILLPDTDRVFVSVGASYKYSERMTLDFAYSHIFFDDAPFCMEAGGTSTHCGSGGTVLLKGEAEGSADLISVGLRYKF
jgi:long-chain fatty acid transport protein